MNIDVQNKIDKEDKPLTRADVEVLLYNAGNSEKLNLAGLNLRGIDLTYFNLAGTDLNGAYLSGANLTGADLNGAYLTQIEFGDTVFAEVDLSRVKGLETAIHNGPSTVDIKSVTLPVEEHSRRHFLRNAGFSDIFIEYLPSLLTPALYPSLFISYSSNDHFFATKLHADLQNQGVRCWFAPHDLRPGTSIVRGIEEAIGYRDTLLLILSEHAIKSRWIEQEVDAALYQEIKRGQDVLFPIRLDHSVLHSDAGWAWKTFLRGHHPILMDYGIINVVHPLDPSLGVPSYESLEPARYAMGDTLRFASRIQLIAMTPRSDLSSTSYALANPGKEYLVLQPNEEFSPFTVTLESGTYTIEWLSISLRQTEADGEKFVERSGAIPFTPKATITGPCVLYLKRQEG